MTTNLIKYNDGSVYKGYTDKNGIKNNYGKLIYPNGDEFDGMWKEDKRNGNGTYIWSKQSKWKGDKYEGNKIELKKINIMI